MTQRAAPDPQPIPTARPRPPLDDDVAPMPSQVTSGRPPRPEGGRWRRAMMPLGKMARRASRRP